MFEEFKAYSSIVKDFFWIIKPFALLFVWYLANMVAVKLAGRFRETGTERIKQRISGAVEQRASVQRAVTISNLVSQIIRGMLAIVMIFWILDSVGIDMRPVIAGVGVVGLALSLAAQNIIRDYLNGFMIIVEDQFNVGDSITTAGYSGTVENFTFRSTKLRDLSGNLITIPNSAILTVQNSSKDWSAAVVDIGVSYGSDYKKALDTAASVAEKLASDLTSGAIGPPSTQGILSFDNNAIMLRTVIKTEPGRQWATARTYRQMLKDAYDEQGITLAHSRMYVNGKRDAEKK